MSNNISFAEAMNYNPDFGYTNTNNLTNYKVPLENKNTSLTTKWGGRDGILSTAGTVAQGVGALGGLYTGLAGLGVQKDQLSLAKEQFGFNKDLSKRNLSNQAQLINEERTNSANVGLALASHMNQQEKDAVRNKVKAGNVKGTI